MKAYQMVRMIKGPYKGERGLIVPPLPRDGRGKYCVQFTDTPNTFKSPRKDLVILKGKKRKIF